MPALLTRYTGTAHYNGRSLHTYTTFAKYKAQAIHDIQHQAAQEHQLTKSDEALIRVDFIPELVHE